MLPWGARRVVLHNEAPTLVCSPTVNERVSGGLRPRSLVLLPVGDGSNWFCPNYTEEEQCLTRFHTELGLK